MQHVKAQIQREVVKETAWAELAILNAASIHTLTTLGKNIGMLWDVTWPGLDRCQTNVFDDGDYCKRGQPERWFSDVSQVGVGVHVGPMGSRGASGDPCAPSRSPHGGRAREISRQLRRGTYKPDW